MLGDHFDDYLNTYTSDDGQGARRFLNQKFFAKLEEIITQYHEIFTEVKKRSGKIKIIVHGYDYARPHPQEKGKWLGKKMNGKGILETQDKNALIKVIIDEFNQKLDVLVQQHSNAHYLDLRGLVPDDEWDDEIHPSDIGFAKVARPFVNLIRDLS